MARGHTTGIPCGDCGRFIAYRDFDEGRVKWEDDFYMGDWLDPPDRHPVCPRCQEKEAA